jgi:segregation and condensation protein A
VFNQSGLFFVPRTWQSHTFVHWLKRIHAWSGSEIPRNRCCSTASVTIRHQDRWYIRTRRVLRRSTTTGHSSGPDVIAPGEGELIVNLEGFEGPLDLLLALARDQKVDLRRISMVALVDQYLAHVAQARRMRLELAADYLVMAAWLAYLKSRLLLPEPAAGEEPSGQEMADALQWQLRRLEAMQEAGVRLMARPQLGKDVFTRGQPEGVVVVRRAVWDVKLYDLLAAYGHQVRPKDADTYQIEPMQFFSVEEAAERLGRMLGIAIDWQTLEAFLPAGLTDPTRRRSAMASTFVAGLQLAKDGQLELRQTERFGPIYLRKRTEQR